MSRASATTNLRETWNVSEPGNSTRAVSPHRCLFWEREEFSLFLQLCQLGEKAMGSGNLGQFSLGWTVESQRVCSHQLPGLFGDCSLSGSLQRTSWPVIPALERKFDYHIQESRTWFIILVVFPGAWRLCTSHPHPHHNKSALFWDVLLAEGM